MMMMMMMMMMISLGDLPSVLRRSGTVQFRLVLQGSNCSFVRLLPPLLQPNKQMNEFINE